MKILHIRFKNLNSLRGEWSINLEDKAYTSNGIFAVTGPTGAGKTTIFDAVCLALYGRTPRLSSVSASTNEVMSKGTGECFAHVTFSTDKGVFTSKWGQHRSGNRPSGKLQSPQHFIEKYNPGSDTGTPLTYKNTDTLKEVVSLTGMDFDRFTRAMMLEQGGFDAFLESSKNDRAQVLELITGTKIYSIISRLVYENTQREKNAVGQISSNIETLKSTHDGMTEEAVNAEIAQRTAELSRLNAEHSKTDSERTILQDIKKLKTELDRANEDIAAQEKRLEDFAVRRKHMDSAERAAVIEADYTSLLHLRKNRADDETECRKMQEGITVSNEELSRLTEALPIMKEELSRVRGSVSEAPDVVALRVKTAVDEYTRAEDEKKRAESDHSKAEQKLMQAKTNLQTSQESGKTARTKMNEAMQEHKDKIGEIMSMRARTASAVFAEARAVLKPGEPCPVCGAVEHPGVAHDETHEKSEELFRRAEQLENALKTCEESVQLARKNFDLAVERWNKVSAAEAEARKEYDSARENLAEKKEKLDFCRSAVSEAIRPLGLSGLTTTREILAKTQEWAQRVSRLEKQIQDAEIQIGKLETGLKTANENLSLRQEALAAVVRELDELESAFREKLNAQNFADESDFSSALQYVKILPELRAKWQELTGRMTELKTAKDIAQQQLDEKTAQGIPAASFDETDALFKRQKAEILSINGKISVLQKEVENIRKLQAQIDELTRDLEEQKVSAKKWAELCGLIGSAKGDKFRIFAQKITLGLVVENANDYRRKMNGRYTLIITPDNDELELSVKDNEQAGEIRPTDNLSGGERFIVSLALALGLSQISGSKARVDSLFLDEGFGSLDEDSLNTALEALGEVRREGRMIGVISHVAALRERIAAQIQVIPKNDGVSILKGPGCSGSNS